MWSDGVAMNRTKDKRAKSSFSKLVITFIYLLIYPVLLFLLAGDWRWAEGWMFSACFCSLSFATVLYLYFKDPALLNERFGSPFQKGQESWDKIVIVLLMVGFLSRFVVMPLDAKRFGWSPPFPLWIKIIGALLFVSSFAVLFGALKENTFASPIVKMQRMRGQRVISTGLYAVVRHPMNTGGLLLFTGAPLLLNSIYGLASGILLTILLAFRAVGEEKMLVREIGRPRRVYEKTQMTACTVCFLERKNH